MRASNPSTWKVEAEEDRSSSNFLLCDEFQDSLGPWFQKGLWGQNGSVEKKTLCNPVAHSSNKAVHALGEGKS